METRKLYVGVSSPVGYSYLTESQQGKPCPILESPLSYLLLYDEIWFLTRRLCPFDLENLDFVHFVDEELRPEGIAKDELPALGDRQLLKLTLSHRLLATRIPSLYSPQGPWHPVIADIRSDPFLKDFRRKIQSSEGLENLESIDEKLRDLCREYEKQVQESVAQRFSTANIYYSTASFILGFVPVVGQIVSTTEWGGNLIQKIQDRRENGWVAFISNIRKPEDTEQKN